MKHISSQKLNKVEESEETGIHFDPPCSSLSHLPHPPFLLLVSTNKKCTGVFLNFFNFILFFYIESTDQIEIQFSAGTGKGMQSESAEDEEEDEPAGTFCSLHSLFFSLSLFPHFSSLLPLSLLFFPWWPLNFPFLFHSFAFSLFCLLSYVGHKKKKKKRFPFHIF